MEAKKLFDEKVVSYPSPIALFGKEDVYFDESFLVNFHLHPQAYDIVENFALTNFYKFNPNKFPNGRHDVSNIVIAGAYWGCEIDIYLNLYPNCIVYAFEPVPEHYKKLHSRFGNNPRVKTFQKALSNKSGQDMMWTLDSEGQASLLKYQGHLFGSGTKPELPIIVDTIRLDEVEDLKNKKIDFFQIDTQGAELMVLQGSSGYIHDINALMMEVHTRDHIHPADKEPYLNQCYLEDLLLFFRNTDMFCWLVGLDNESGNGQGNSFWFRSSEEQQ